MPPYRTSKAASSSPPPRSCGTQRSQSVFEETPQRPPVRVTYIGRRTIASTSRHLSPRPTPPLSQRRPHEIPSSPEREKTPSDPYLDILDVFRSAEDRIRQKENDQQAAREAVRRDAREDQEQAVALPDAQVIMEMRENVERNGDCAICWSAILGTPYILACGHSYCGPCLERTFGTLLKKSMKRLKYRAHVAHTAGDCQTMPRTASQRDRLAECLSLHGLKPERVFRYPCPLCLPLVPCRTRELGVRANEGGE
ncbi:hypothetical protein NMY22_g7060 [Coprinellus aureogranulatus]|nr:hypothetical protein NMY22_g7060 [Coprinellus aureogranulatus]